MEHDDTSLAPAPRRTFEITRPEPEPAEQVEEHDDAETAETDGPAGED